MLVGLRSLLAVGQLSLWSLHMASSIFKASNGTFNSSYAFILSDFLLSVGENSAFEELTYLGLAHLNNVQILWSTV